MQQNEIPISSTSQLIPGLDRINWGGVTYTLVKIIDTEKPKFLFDTPEKAILILTQAQTEDFIRAGFLERMAPVKLTLESL